jgi:hypothetical protein
MFLLKQGACMSQSSDRHPEFCTQPVIRWQIDRLKGSQAFTEVAQYLYCDFNLLIIIKPYIVVAN